MEKIKKFSKERRNGLFLLSIAGLIAFSFFTNSQNAESENGQGLVAEEQVLGETDSNVEEAVPEEAVEPSEEVPEVPVAETVEKPSIEETGDEAAAADSEDIFYNELKAHLKKYCGKNYNVKKCRDYLLEARDAKKKGARFKELYKKYHFEKKEEKKSSVVVSNTVSEEKKSRLSVVSGSTSKSYEIAVPSGISALDLMGLLQKDSSQNFSYHSSFGFVDEINGTGNQGNMSWMLYACKDNVCKLSNTGASDCKIDNLSKVEWRYLDWTIMTDTDWAGWEC